VNPRLAARLQAFGFALLWAASVPAADDPRYDEIRRLIRANRHLGPHMTMAIDARTIKAVRGRIRSEDIPTLVRMMGDKDYGVASAASSLLVTLGRQAEPALEAATHARDSGVAGQARDALNLLEVCYDPAQRDVTSADVCPADR
jgi:hypothetical protein